jgi:DNA-binding MarR family transcriptional regulator
LTRALSKTGTTITPDRLNKILLDLEIMGLIRVSWLTKDTRRIEVVVTEVEEDEYDEQNKEMMEKDYEASFPGLEES